MYDRQKHHRRSVRLHGYDYSQPGEYFLTLCVQDMNNLFGRVVDGQTELSPCGKIVDEEWHGSARIRREIELDEWVVMPNHVHGIVRIVGASRVAPAVRAQGLAPLRPPQRIPMRPPRSLASFVWGFKAAVTKRINAMRHTPGSVVWQRNYYEHIIRNPAELEKIRAYIRENPLRWACDRYNPERGLLVISGDGRVMPWEM
jgi:REP element-mobilizing transposase RayT